MFALAAIDGEASRPRVIVPDMGGGFGAKSGSTPRSCLLGWAGAGGSAAGALGRDPQREHALPRPRPGPGQGPPGRHPGRPILAYRLEVLQDAGRLPPFGAILP